MPTLLLPRLYRSFHSRLTLSACVPTVLLQDSTGISTCYPSTTSFDLALGPDLPRADQLYSGNLRYSAGRIPTFLSLLIPAFSLLKNPQLLPVLLRLFKNAPLPIEIHQFQSFGLLLTSPLNLPAPGRRQPIYLTFRFCIDLCFC